LSAALHVLTGARAGLVVALPRDAIVGRRTDADLQFDAERDLEVSARHALIACENGRWFVRDLGSRNGTYVNGDRIREAELRSGDRIMFGWHGPTAEFRLTDAPAAAQDPGTTRSTPVVHASGTQQVRAQNVRLRQAVTMLSIALIVLSGAMVLLSRRASELREQERAALLARIDTLLAAGDSAVQALAGQREELANALRQSQDDVRRVRDEIARATTTEDTTGVPDLRRQLQAAMAALERQQLAASLDFERIERDSRRAVAVLWVESATGTVMTGTAFAVRPDATLVTSRHLVRDDRGRPARRLAIQFSDSDQVWPARILTVSQNADVAIIKVDNIAGAAPVVRSLNLQADTLHAGSPVALIGFPLGGETWPQDARTGRLARPLGSVGVLLHQAEDAIEIQGYGAAGASGSPIFDARGEVIAVLMGGRQNGTLPQLSAVPITSVLALLERLP
jgi:S1-C subfamily serine protease